MIHSRKIPKFGWLTVAVAGLFACSVPPAEDQPSTEKEAAVPASTDAVPSTDADSRSLFVDRAAELGLDFTHANGMTGKLYFVEIVGSGAALLDYDDDGDLDVYLVQGTPLVAEGDDPGDPWPEPTGDRLFQNRLQETGTLSFVDVSDRAGDLGSGYGMGVAAGDFDDDGFVDLYVTHLQGNQMLRNLGDGTFRDVTAETGTDDPRWSVSASFVDYDLDGRLDLFVGNYVDFTLESNKECFSPTSARDYCGPLSYEAYPDRLFRNLGPSGGTVRFEDVSVKAGILAEYGAALGVVAADFDGDGRPDFYVANDGTANQMWIQGDGGRFENQALLAGTAFNQEGKAEASMGLVAGDYDGDGDEDLFMTHLGEETDTLYRNDGTGLFTDVSLDSGLALSSTGFTGFGTGWIDYDNDGRLDLLVVNGAVKRIPAQERAGDPFPLRQTNQLLHNAGGGRFEDVTARAGAAFEPEEVSRGLALGDVDNDGDTDAVVMNNNGPARLLINEIGQENGWIGLRLRLREGGRDAHGARLAVRLDDGRVLWRRPATDGSYASASDPRVLVGLGSAAATEVEVHWPGGGVERFDLAERESRAYHTLVLGTGEALGTGIPGAGEEVSR